MVTRKNQAGFHKKDAAKLATLIKTQYIHNHQQAVSSLENIKTFIINCYSYSRSITKTEKNK